MSKLYAVTLEIAMNVIADSEDEAIRLATTNVREEDADSFAVLSVQDGVAAAGWPNSCIPYAERGKNTHGSVGAWLRHGKDGKP